MNSALTPVMRPGHTTPVIQGEHRVSADPDCVLSTLLGSCVTTCLHDPVAKIGGMNHFLVATGAAEESRNQRYGLYAMEVLINALLKLGGSKNRLQAKLFGGAMMSGKMARIGQANSEFALGFLRTEGINVLSSSLGGNRARRVKFVPTTGQASLLFVEDMVETPKPLLPVDALRNDVTLF